MNLTKVNNIIYKATCAICCIAAVILGLKILSDLLIVKGYFALVAAAIFGLLFFQRASLRTWLQVAAVGIVSYWIISELAKI